MNNKNKFFIVDTTLIGLLAASGISGLLLWTAIPKGTALRRLIKDIHKWTGMSLAGLAAYHLILHWDWFIKTSRDIIVGSDPKKIKTIPKTHISEKTKHIL